MSPNQTCSMLLQPTSAPRSTPLFFSTFKFKMYFIFSNVLCVSKSPESILFWAKIGSHRKQLSLRTWRVHWTMADRKKRALEFRHGKTAVRILTWSLVLIFKRFLGFYPNFKETLQLGRNNPEKKAYQSTKEPWFRRLVWQCHRN